MTFRLGEMLRFYIGFHRLSTSKVAQEMGISQATLLKYIRGEGSKITDDILLQVIDWCIQKQPELEVGVLPLQRVSKVQESIPKSS